MPIINKLQRKKREYISDKKKERKFIYSRKEWRYVRDIKFRANPICEKCLEDGIVTPTKEIHHIDSFMNYEGEMRWSKAFDYNNLMSLCTKCHNDIHKAQGQLYHER